ncbi:hypothetical protein [Zhihengliuella halotolerans]|uniref:hypothetical protein n=1 Tax=Zhihengliuella halotolerans TaxID=370736 RepID=UPI0011AF58B8|nr:hypothetical protein [Zhihengliuella halotolerans]
MSAPQKACVGCGVLLVPIGQPTGEGVKQNAGRGRCRSCYNRDYGDQERAAKRAAKVRKALDVPLEEITDPKVRNNRTGLDRMLAERRARLRRLQK